MSNRRKLKFPLLILGDILIFYGSLWATLSIRYPHNSLTAEVWDLHWIPFSVLFGIWILVYISLGLYEVRITKNEPQFTERLIRVIFINAAFGILLFYGIHSFQITPRVNLFLVLILSSVFVFIWRYIFNKFIAPRGAERVLFFGLSEDIVHLAKELQKHPQFAFQPVVFVAINEEEKRFPVQPIFLLDHNLQELIKRFSIDTVVASEDVTGDEKLVRMFFEVLPLGISIIHFPIFYEMITGKIPVSLITEAWFLKNFNLISHIQYEKIKRVIDIILACIFSIPAFILFPFIATGIRIDSRGPIFYRQKRIGKEGKFINIIKFRSMKLGAETHGAVWADENDPRITKIGGFLRKTRLDEIPQLLNIIRGDMSFIGPRPERPEFVNTLKEQIPFYQIRHLVRPGLTGWAQINFPYGASVSDAMEKLQYDIYYIKNISPGLDFQIFLQTITVVLSRKGR